MYFLKISSGQSKWSLILFIINIVSVIALPLEIKAFDLRGTHSPSPIDPHPHPCPQPTSHPDLSILTFFVKAVNNVQKIYKRWQIMNCPNLEVAVYGDCFIKSQVTLIAVAAAASSVVVVLICFLCRRRKKRAYRKSLLTGGGSDGGLGQRWQDGQNSWLENWFKERRKRRMQEREERWVREREKEIERRRRKEKKAKRAKG